MEHVYQYPTVTEIPRQMQPVDRDTFIDEFKKPELKKQPLDVPRHVGEVALVLAHSS